MSDQFQQTARDVLTIECNALRDMAERIDESFSKACQMILSCEGRVVVVGMGKSGHIGGKIAASLASTGTPSFFVHPGEASHGDLGMITPSDLVIAISNSGETPEILTILPIVKRMEVRLIALTSKCQSNLGKISDICLDVGVEKEACPHDLAPTTSTTATLAMGDALVVAVLQERGFTRNDFARSHPGGALGRRLLLYVKDIMHSGDKIPIVQQNASLKDALIEMNDKSLGMTCVVDSSQKLIGIFTDGDLRRAFETNLDLNNSSIKNFMSADPKTTTPDTMAAQLIKIMREHSINGIFVVDEEQRVKGALNTLDLIRAGIV